MVRYDISIKNKDSLDYAHAEFYGHEESPIIPIKKRPVVIVVPGGGYDHTSDRESDIVAAQFVAMGYHAAVLRYSCKPAVYPTALLELAELMRQLRMHEEEWLVDTQQLITMGFSAGGHLTASLAAFWNKGFLSEKLGCKDEDIRPNAQILGYPVITSGEYAHEGSFRSLLGEAYDEKKEEMSLENCVDDAVPRSFVWHTTDDRSVPVQNSLLYVSALAKAGIAVEYHLFEHGSHGSGLGTRLTAMEEKHINPSITPWIELVHDWIERGL